MTLVLSAVAVYVSIGSALADEQPLRAAALGMLLGMGGGLLLGLLSVADAACDAAGDDAFALRDCVFAVLLMGRFWPAAGSVGLWQQSRDVDLFGAVGRGVFGGSFDPARAVGQRTAASAA